MESNDPIDLAVIGGGLAGLAAAALAARGGANVRLFERARMPGGRAATQEKEGFSLNLGPHALYRAAAGAAVLSTLDIKPRGAPPPLTGGHAIRAGRSTLCPAACSRCSRPGSSACGPNSKPRGCWRACPSSTPCPSPACP